MRNDALGIGLLPMCTKYAAMMNENEISMNIVSILYRIDQLISADDDRTAASAMQYLNDILVGKLGVISSSEFFEGLKVDSSRSGVKSITDLIEYEQYLKASWYNEIGLNSNYNMKRERIVSAEAELTDDALIPLVENMLYQRTQAIEHIKDLYGNKYDLSDLSCELNSIWDLDHMYTSIPESEQMDIPQENEDITDDNGNTDYGSDLVGSDDSIDGNEVVEQEEQEESENTLSDDLEEITDKIDDVLEKLEDIENGDFTNET